MMYILCHGYYARMYVLNNRFPRSRTDQAPRTCENFRALCTGEKGDHMWFRGNGFHRIISGFMAQAGDITSGSGSRVVGVAGVLGIVGILGLLGLLGLLGIVGFVGLGGALGLLTLAVTRVHTRMHLYIILLCLE